VRKRKVALWGSSFSRPFGPSTSGRCGVAVCHRHHPVRKTPHTHTIHPTGSSKCANGRLPFGAHLSAGPSGRPPPGVDGVAVSPAPPRPGKHPHHTIHPTGPSSAQTESCPLGLIFPPALRAVHLWR
jgi:hypothetical protein